MASGIIQGNPLAVLALAVAATILPGSLEVSAQSACALCDQQCCDGGCCLPGGSAGGCGWLGGLCSPSKRCSPGTLFRWSGCPNVSGGPDLNAPLVTDRPDFTEASSTVGVGVAQLEFGYTYFFDDDNPGDSKTQSYPETLLRYGLLRNWLELRVAWNYADEDVAGLITSGSEDLYLGFKVGLTPQAGYLPEMALIPQMTVPTGSSDLTSDEVLPGLNWIYGWELSDCLSTAGSTQFNRLIDAGSDQSYTEWAQSWTVAYSLSERWGAYTEWFALFPHSAATAQVEHYFNGGFTYLINNNIQWDIRGGTGLNAAADDYFVGSGLSIRFL